jgi:uncharacterized membrane protein
MQPADEIVHLFNFIGSLVCHQRPERALWIGGRYLPVCARDTGALIGLLAGYGLLLFLRKKEARGPPNLYMTLVMMLPMLTDSFGQLFGFWTSTNDVRLLTGLLFGTALAPMLVYMLTLSPLKGKIPALKKLQPDAVALDDMNSWLDAKALIVGTVLSIGLFLIIRAQVGSEFALFYWLLSVPTVAGIMWHVFVLPPLLLAVALSKHLRRK